MFDDIRERKKAFLDEFKKIEKIGIFPKGLVQVFGQKIENFSSFFFNKIGQENVFDDIQERKNHFLQRKRLFKII